MAITGTVKSVEMNTYGRVLTGMFEGFGSAGNYGEANIIFSNVTVQDAKGKIVWQGGIAKYGKLLNCPVQLDWTAFTLVSKSLMMSAAGSDPTKLVNAVKSSGGDYHIEAITENPVEMAARLAAIDLIGFIENNLSSGSVR
ncbi:MAG: hypothetical protein PHY31_00500 [Smithellaceae bacterium]|nr:hypothetical protein [Smithellaceae bacterium]